MATVDVSMTNDALPFGDGIEIMARRKDSNLPSVVMDWPNRRLWVDYEGYDRSVIDRLIPVLYATLKAGGPNFTRADRLEQFRKDLRGE
jgi:hypothetical protein